MSEEQGREILAYVRERDEAREDQKKVEEELQEVKSKLYDANNKVERLKRSLNHAQKQGAANAPKGGQATKLAPPPAKGKAPAAKGGVDKAKKAESASSTPNVTPAPTPPPAPPRPTTSVRHPPIIGKEELSDDTYAYYTALGEMFPLLPMLTILNAEKKYNEADVNGDGVVDREEIDDVLSKDVAMFTPAQVEEIIKEIDKDNTGDLDFTEVLAVLEKMTRRRNHKLPAAINDNKDKVCAIQ